MISTFHPSTLSLIIKNNNLTESAKRYANFISREPNLSYLVVTVRSSEQAQRYLDQMSEPEKYFASSVVWRNSGIENQV